MPFTIFYAWQSDTDSKLNRYFIRDAIQSSIKAISEDYALDESPRLDHDTKDVAGSPDIVATIFNKIEACEVFIADVTPVADINAAKSSPNPNVMIELGYALARLRDKRLITIMNTAYGKPQQLPFDFRSRRFPIQYCLPQKARPEKSIAITLRQALEAAVRRIVASEPNILARRDFLERTNQLRSQARRNAELTCVTILNAAEYVFRRMFDPLSWAPDQDAERFVHASLQRLEGFNAELSVLVPALDAEIRTDLILLRDPLSRIVRSISFFSKFHASQFQTHDFISEYPISAAEEVELVLNRLLGSTYPKHGRMLRATSQSLQTACVKAEMLTFRLFAVPEQYNYSNGRIPFPIDLNTLRRLPEPSAGQRIQVFYNAEP